MNAVFEFYVQFNVMKKDVFKLDSNSTYFTTWSISKQLDYTNIWSNDAWKLGFSGITFFYVNLFWKFLHQNYFLKILYILKKKF